MGMKEKTHPPHPCVCWSHIITSPDAGAKNDKNTWTNLWRKKGWKKDLSSSLKSKSISSGMVFR
jgi:hypothetical protein